MGILHLTLLSSALAALIIFISKLITRATNGNQLPYPPGPKPKVLIGNMLDIPAVDVAQVYAEWGKRYNSGIVHASAFGTHIVVVNSRKIADDLFEKRSNLYSDRPYIPMIGAIGFGWNVAFYRYGDSWRMHRKLFQQLFNQKSSKVYQDMQIAKVHKMLRGLLAAPDKFEVHNKMLSTSIPLSIMYGYEARDVDDPIIKAADDMVSLGGQLLPPGAPIINMLPFLRHIPTWVPGAKSQKKAAEVIRLVREMKRLPMEYVRRAITEGTASSAVVANFIETKGTTATPEEESVVKNVAYTAYGAASDTTIAATEAFLHQIATHPEVQRKAQAEIDSVLNRQRLPDFADRESLPYVEAIYRELLRCHPPVPLGVPHATTADDVYGGHFIPKGSIVIGNIFAITHDEGVYQDPFSFKPERFLHDDGQLNDDSRIWAYGFGRRVCVGQHVASSTLWMTMVSILACFEIGHEKDELGNVIQIDDDYEDCGIMHHKKPFKCSIKPRSEHTRRLIEESVSTRPN